MKKVSVRAYVSYFFGINLILILLANLKTPQEERLAIFNSSNPESSSFM